MRSQSVNFEWKVHFLTGQVFYCQTHCRLAQNHRAITGFESQNRPARCCKITAARVRPFNLLRHLPSMRNWIILRRSEFLFRRCVITIQFLYCGINFSRIEMKPCSRRSRKRMLPSDPQSARSKHRKKGSHLLLRFVLISIHSGSPQPRKRFNLSKLKFISCNKMLISEAMRCCSFVPDRRISNQR